MMHLDPVLEPCVLGPPQIFDRVGGTRLFLVSGGPCQRLARERTDGVCDISNAKPHAYNQDFSFVAQKMTQELEAYLNTAALYPGARQDNRPTIWHDGRLKSIGSYDIFKRTALYGFDDALKHLDYSIADTVDMAAYFWKHGLNREDRSTVRTAILFCGVETMYRILRKCGLITETSRIQIASGGFFTVNVPIGARPSFTLGMGPFGRQSLCWGNATKTEAETKNGVQEEDAAEETVETGEDAAEETGEDAAEETVEPGGDAA